MKNNKDKDYAVSYIRELITNWISENEQSRNLAAFAKKSGVSETSLRRILNYNSMPNETNLRKIFFTLNPGKAWHEIMSNMDSSVARFVRNTFAILEMNEKRNVVVLDENSASVMNKSSIHTCVFSLSSVNNGKGTAYESIVDLFGRLGSLAIEDLLKAKLVDLKDNVVSISKELNDARLDPFESKIFVENLFSTFYKPETNMNFLGFTTESISYDGFCKVALKLENTFAEIESLIKSHPGEIPVSVAVFTDTMDLKIKELQ